MASTASAVIEVVELIRREFIPRVRFTADDIYSHKSEPTDLDMYMALGILVKKEEILDLNNVHESAHNGITHTGMIYCIPGEDGYKPCHCRDCMETAIGFPGVLCHHCNEADCDPMKECQSEVAYGGPH